MTNYSFSHTSELVKYKDKYIQTYTFGEGEKIVLSLPSFPHSGLTYLLYLRYRRHVNVKFITLDIPGWIGLSENIFNDNKFNFEEIVNISQAILNHYKVDRFSLIGYSFGGAMSLKIASKFHNKVDKIILVSTVINGNLLKHIRTVRLIKIAYILKLSKALRNVINKHAFSFFDFFLKQGIPLNLIEEYKAMLNRINNKVILDAAYKLFNSDFTEEFKNILDKDFMIINSVDEPEMFRIQAEYIRRVLKGEKSIYLHGTHDDFIFKPDSAVVNKVLEFLSSN